MSRCPSGDAGEKCPICRGGGRVRQQRHVPYVGAGGRGGGGGGGAGTSAGTCPVCRGGVGYVSRDMSRMLGRGLGGGGGYVSRDVSRMSGLGGGGGYVIRDVSRTSGWELGGGYVSRDVSRISGLGGGRVRQQGRVPYVGAGAGGAYVSRDVSRMSGRVPATALHSIRLVPCHRSFPAFVRGFVSVLKCRESRTSPTPDAREGGDRSGGGKGRSGEGG